MLGGGSRTLTGWLRRWSRSTSQCSLWTREENQSEWPSTTPVTAQRWIRQARRSGLETTVEIRERFILVTVRLSGGGIQTNRGSSPPAQVRQLLALTFSLSLSVRLQNKYIYEELQTDKFFSIRMVGVENSKRGMGVATELIRR